MPEFDIESQRGAILEEWREALFATYSDEAHRFLKGNRDRIGNPIGQAILRATEESLPFLFGTEDAKCNYSAINDLIRIRAVQDFTASQAAGIFQALKKVLFDHLWSFNLSETQMRKFFALLSRVDEMQLTAFELYTSHRARLAEIRVDESRRRYARVLTDSRFLVEESQINQPSETLDSDLQNNNGAAL